MRVWSTTSVRGPSSSVNALARTTEAPVPRLSAALKRVMMVSPTASGTFTSSSRPAPSYSYRVTVPRRSVRLRTRLPVELL